MLNKNKICFLILVFLFGSLQYNTFLSKNQNNLNSNKLKTGLKASSLISEDKDDFSEGLMENLTISGANELLLGINWNNWTNLNPSTPKPSARNDHSMVYDSNHDRVILFGGNDGSADDETWVYNYTDNSWTNMNPSTPKPSARRFHSMAYDSTHDRVVLFGGWDGSYDNETWVYNFTDNTWTNMNPSSLKPSGRFGHSMVYDSTHDRMILFGGIDGGTGGRETWVYNYTDNTWTNMNPSSSKPTGRQFHSMVYDSTHDRVILFGGNDNTANDETWVYNYTDNTWTNMNPSSPKPNARDQHSMVYDSTHDRIILFGGYNPSGMVRFDDTWIYTLTDNIWKNVIASIKPSSRFYCSIAYDSTNDRVILFGGNDGSVDDETWEYFFQDNYYQNGTYTSTTKDLTDMYKITGNITWEPSTQPIGTNLQVQIGISPTTSDEDFIFTAPNSSIFKFNGEGRYIKYQIHFSADSSLSLSPKINIVNITYSLEQIKTNFDDDDDDDEIKDEGGIDPTIIILLISIIATFGIVIIVLGVYFQRNPEKLKSLSKKLRSR